MLDESNGGAPKQPTVPNGLPNGVKPPDSMIPKKTKEDIIKRVQQMDVNDMLEIVMEEGALQSIKIINNWLQYDQEVLKSCGTNTRSLIRQITYLLNLININLTSHSLIGVSLKLSEVIRKENLIPLSEDVVLKGLEILNSSQSSLDWQYTTKRGISLREENVVRIVKLMCFGKFLTSLEETGVGYAEENNCFVCKEFEKEGDGSEKVSTIFMDEVVSFYALLAYV